MKFQCAHRWSFLSWGGPLQSRTEELTPATGNTVRVRVSHCGVCHSDLHIREGGFDMGGGKRSSIERIGATLPLTPGHEICGEVVETGPDVTGVKLGERVIVYPWLGCGKCSTCLAGDEQLCRFAANNLGMQAPGGFSDLVSVPHERYVVPLGNVDPGQGATFACAGITAWSALKKLSPAQPDDWIAILGCGGLGMTAIALLAATSPAKVVAIDTDPAKRETALRYGASLAFDPAEPQALKTISKACSHNIAGAVDFVGAETTTLLAANLVRRSAEVVIVGMFGGELTIPLPLFPMKSLSIKGSYCGSLNDLRELVALASQARLPQIPLEFRPLAQANQALDDLANGKVAGRVVLTP